MDLLALFQKALRFVERLRDTKTDRKAGSEDYSQGHNREKTWEGPAATMPH